MSTPNYLSIEATINQLRGAKDKFTAKTAGSSCDKKGIGFNLDNRFTAFTMQVSLDSWAGYYGNSSCSTVIDFTDREAVKDAFAKWLNLNIWRILPDLADIIEKANEGKKKEHIAKLQAELARLTATTETEVSHVR